MALGSVVVWMFVIVRMVVTVGMIVIVRMIVCVGVIVIVEMIVIVLVVDVLYARSDGNVREWLRVEFPAEEKHRRGAE